MAVVVETGAIIAGADSYISSADAIVYLDNYATTGSANAFTIASTTVQDAALRQATRFLDANYGLLFVGRRYSRDQRLQWPRASAADNDGHYIASDSVPQLVKDATCELALVVAEDLTQHATRGLQPNQSTPGSVKSQRQKADVVEIETVWVGGADQQTLYAIVDAMLQPLLETRRVALG